MNITAQFLREKAVNDEDLSLSGSLKNGLSDENIKFSITKCLVMNRIQKFLPVLSLVGVCIFFCNFSSSKPIKESVCLALPTEVFASIQRNGKFNDARLLSKTFTRTDLDKLGFPVITQDVKLALLHQLHVLEKNETDAVRKIGNIKTSYGEMREVLELLIQRAGTQPNDLNQYLDAWQTKGDDRMGNVHFTGYFTPVLKVKKSKDSIFRYPIYAYPRTWKGKLPNRMQIEKKGALDTMNLVLAYATNPLDVYFMQLQGSGTVEFIDANERALLRYAGENGHPYRNIQRFFRKRSDLGLNNLSPEGIKRFLMKHPEKMDSVLHYDPSYTFFEVKKGLAKGSANVPLMEEISIAADSRYFPLGSVVLAAVPVYENDKVTHHEYKIFLPQDVGGAIKGAGHVDVYCGNGALGQARASSLHHYGRLWVLLPKNNEKMALAD